MIHSKLFIKVASKGDREEFYVFVFFLAFFFLSEDYLGGKNTHTPKVGVFSD